MFRSRGARLVVLVVLVLVVSLSGIPLGAQPASPRTGGTLFKTDIYGDPENLDPIVRVGVRTVMVTMNIFDGLVKLDAERGTVVPDIASRWTLSPDRKVYTFTLRRGVLFHDGTAVTAADFKYSFERVANPANVSPALPRLAGVTGAKAFQAGTAQGIAGIKVLDSHTLQITLEEPDNLFLYDLTEVWASVVPRQAVERLGREFGSRPVGSGPFMFENWLRDAQVVLRRFDRYWRTDASGNRLPYLDRAVFRIMREMSTIEAEFEAGNLDFSVMLDPQYLKYTGHPVYKNNLVGVAELFTRHIGFNLSQPGAPWLDKRVRQAINYAIDRKAIVDKVLHGKAYPATGIFPPSLAGYDRTLTGYEYNPDRAKRLLAEAGFPNGFAVKIISTDHPAYGLPAVEAVMGYLSAVGIRVQPEVMESAALSQRTHDGNYEWYSSSVGGATHPLAYLRRRFHSRFIGAPGNFTRYKNATVDNLLDQAAEASDTATMLRLVRQAERIIVDEAPWWFSNYNKAVIAHQPYVRGLRPIPTDIDFQPLEEVWFSASPRRR